MVSEHRGVTLKMKPAEKRNWKRQIGLFGFLIFFLNDSKEGTLRALMIACVSLLFDFFSFSVCSWKTKPLCAVLRGKM